MSATHAIPIRAAATVVMLRTGEYGPEVFMLRRHQSTVFGPGAYVFPGGAVDAGDDDPDWLARCDGLDDVMASRRLGLARGGLAFWVGAVRECFEESGLLLATDRDGRELDPGRDFSAARAHLNAGGGSFAAICVEHKLRLPLSRLFYYSHWTTPVGAPRRFSTRFFVCRAPAAHAQASADGEETVAGLWLAPATALAAYRRGAFPMMLPTAAHVRFFARYGSVSKAIAALGKRTGRLAAGR